MSENNNTIELTLEHQKIGMELSKKITNEIMDTLNKLHLDNIANPGQIHSIAMSVLLSLTYSTIESLYMSLGRNNSVDKFSGFITFVARLMEEVEETIFPGDNEKDKS